MACLGFHEPNAYFLGQEEVQLSVGTVADSHPTVPDAQDAQVAQRAEDGLHFDPVALDQTRRTDAGRECFLEDDLNGH